ncbi:MAG: hypothetical protein VYC34_03870, partial [Planctomycetota bacterium]|nr:hypothetical protein [Planctomycetota bacterium]
EAQRLVRAGSHPDLHVITKELALYSEDRETRNRKLITIPLEVIRERLLAPVVLAGQVRAGGLADRVFIIDEAELLNIATQNAILKTLEEPPAGAVIILVTSNAERLLPTIQSRCQRVSFETLDNEAMRQWMERLEESRGRKVGPAERKWVVEQFASGSPGRALTAIEGGFHQWWETLDPMLAQADRGFLDANLGATMAKLTDEWAKGWVDANENASKDAANKAGARHLLTLLAERARSALRRGVEGESVEGGVRPGAEQALRCIDHLEEAERELNANVQLGVVMDALAVRLAAGR